MILDVLLEDAGREGCMAHVPSLPGHSFRVSTIDDLETTAPMATSTYARYLSQASLTSLTSATESLMRAAENGTTIGFRVAEHVSGAPVWESGNAAALFEWDRRALSDSEIRAHLHFVRRTLEELRATVSSMSPDRRRTRPASNRRSADETFEHVGNCIWWYCSRIDDALSEPVEIPHEDPLDRIDRLFEAAEGFLLGVPVADRATIHRPTRFPTKDPNERWTHTKACRRQAEHAWAHVRGVRWMVETLDKE